MSQDEIYSKRLKSLVRHIETVQKNCEKLAEALSERGEVELAHKLIAVSYLHDNSKFYSIEWDYLNEETKKDNPELFHVALKNHWSNNPHHIQYWANGIHDMPRIYKCEMLADWSARSAEFGTSVRDYLKDVAIKQFGITVQHKIYKEIKDLADLLLDQPFK
jgi:hypothetical protein